jgi:hypothetical protein
MKGEIIPQSVLKNLTMVDKDMNLSCVFSIDVDEPHSLVKALNNKYS